jgi:uncharacterized delta-60 repeat protein
MGNLTKGEAMGLERSVVPVLGVLALGLGLAAGTSAATGLDAGFGSAGGLVMTPLAAGTVDRYYGVTTAPDGGTYNVGVITTAERPGDQRFALTHVDASGKLDRSFGTDGVASINVYQGGLAEIARGVVVQAHGANKGKIVISGQAESAADPADVDIYVVRFDANGTPDTSFGDEPGSAVRVLNLSPGIVGSTRSPDNTWGLMIQPDDKLVIEAVRGNGAPGTPNANRADRDLAAVRLNANGTRDRSFGADGVASIGAVFTESGQTVQAVENPRQGVIQPDGKIVLGGYAQVNGLERPLLARFNSDGTPDATFGGDAGAQGIATAFPNGQNGTAEVYELALQGTKLVTAGYGTPTPQTSPPDMISLRFTSTGRLDTTYADNGIFRYDGQGAADRARDLTLLPDGRIVLAGATETLVPGVGAATNALLAVLKPNGALDTSFGKGGVLQVDPGGTADWFYGTTLLPSGKVIAVGYKGGVPTDGDDAAIARFDVGYVPVPVATVAGIEADAKLKRGPATLTGTVTPASGVSKVIVKLTRGSGAACRAFNLAKQSFSGQSCAANGGFAAVYANGRWTAYLGAVLPKGSYELQAVAVMPTGRKQPVTDGANRIRFSVTG